MTISPWNLYMCIMDMGHNADNSGAFGGKGRRFNFKAIS
jgi:hypothetical protein